MSNFDETNDTYIEKFIHNSVEKMVELDIIEYKKNRYIGRKQKHLLWHLIHSLTHIYPENPSHDEKILFADFFVMHLKNLIPFCGGCKEHYEETIKTADFNEMFTSRETLMKYFIDFHNKITEKVNANKKFEYKLFNYDEVNNFYNEHNFIDYFNNFLNIDIKKLIYDANYEEITKAFNNIYIINVRDNYLFKM